MIYNSTKSYRFRQWNFSRQAVYFVRIWTKNRIRYFGNIENGVMKFSRIGYHADCSIRDITSRNKNIKVLKWQVMPDHVLLLLRVKLLNNKTISLSPPPKPSSFQIYKGIKKRKIQPPDKSPISNAINHYKGRVTLWCRNHKYPEFQWQERYFDKMIYYLNNYDKAVKFIEENPAKWQG